MSRYHDCTLAFLDSSFFTAAGLKVTGDIPVNIIFAIEGEEASLTAKEAAGAAHRLGIEARVAESVFQAVGDLVSAAERPGRILICGSLYLAGHVLAENG